jgi:ATPase subunit of ABC transporter with duplicated ATPase domains
MLSLQNISYSLPDDSILLDHIQLTVNSKQKVVLIGNNGVGKSTLLKIILGQLQPDDGEVILHALPYEVPQLIGQYNHLTVAQSLKVEDKLQALSKILQGEATEENYAVLAEDWTIEERCLAALQHWALSDIGLSQRLNSLSGGQKTKVFLAGISVHQPELVLMDEPSNHLDMAGRQLLYDFVENSKCTLLLVSHDRKLLNLVDTVCELSKQGIKLYGGNYAFYTAQKEIENRALSQELHSKEKDLRKAKDKGRETVERLQKADSRGKGKQEKAGVARIMLNTLRNKAENSTAKAKSVHAEKISHISQELQELRTSLPDLDKMRFGFSPSALHSGKILFEAKAIQVAYDQHLLWKSPLSLQIRSGERIALKGNNGSGKTTLIHLVLGKLEPCSGTVYRAIDRAIYIDQDYSLLENRLSVYDQAQRFNTYALQEHEVKIRLNRFLFSKDDWNKPCHALSGGEKMRLMLCYLTIGQQSPDLIVLDEPTNNLDIQNIGILTAAINEYNGTLLVVSHDENFLEEVNVERYIEL